MLRHIASFILAVLPSIAWAESSPIWNLRLASTCLTVQGEAKEGAFIIMDDCKKVGPDGTFTSDGEHVKVGPLCVASPDGTNLTLEKCSHPKVLILQLTEGRQLRTPDKRCLSHPSATERDFGIKAVMGACNGAQYQQWYFPAGTPTAGTQIESARESGLCMGVTGALNEGGGTVRMIQCSSDYGPGAKFKFVDGHIRTKDLCFARVSGNQVRSAPCAQKNVITFTSSQAGVLRTSDGGCLDFESGRPPLTSMILVSNCNGSPTQQWKFSESFAETTAAATPTPPPQPAPAPAPAPVVAPATTPAPIAGCDADVGPLLATLKGQSFNEDKVKTLKGWAPSHHCSIADVGRIIDAFSFNQDKITALKALRPGIVDLSNGSKLLSRFTFAEDQETAKKILAP